MVMYFTGLSEVEGTQKDHQVQLLGEWPTQGWNPQLGVIGIMLRLAGLILESLQGTYFNLQSGKAHYY